MRHDFRLFYVNLPLSPQDWLKKKTILSHCRWLQRNKRKRTLRLIVNASWYIEIPEWGGETRMKFFFTKKYLALKHVYKNFR